MTVTSFDRALYHGTSAVLAVDIRRRGLRVLAGKVYLTGSRAVAREFASIAAAGAASAGLDRHGLIVSVRVDESALERNGWVGYFVRTSVEPHAILSLEEFEPVWPALGRQRLSDFWCLATWRQYTLAAEPEDDRRGHVLFGGAAS
jgi:hypothetical protein